nr:putative lipid II flippase MurJ isoform X3 [Ipomoea batatas]GMC93545.1 putative lipid II flippase MurJ isoform X3 [Ipomoea batatas]GMC97355.1 putative lipid II flippase MurJ isoform X3 [Ipomoea batatas]
MVECELNFRYAWVLPGFAASVLGGVNGPIHITMTTTLSKLPEERQKKLFQHTSIILFLVCKQIKHFYNSIFCYS